MTLRLKPKFEPNVITQLLPNRSFDTSNLFHMRALELADPNFIVSSPIELILKSDVAEEILDGKFTGDNGLHFRNTVFGWIVSGKQPNQACSIANTSLCINKTPAKHRDVFLPFRFHHLSHSYLKNVSVVY